MRDIQILVKPNGTVAETAALVAAIVGGEVRKRDKRSGFAIEKPGIGLVVDEHDLVDDTAGPTFSKYPHVVDVTALPDREADVRLGREVLLGLRTAGLEALLVEDQYEVLDG